MKWLTRKVFTRYDMLCIIGISVATQFSLWFLLMAFPLALLGAMLEDRFN